MLTENLVSYNKLLKKEIELRQQVIQIQNPAIEEERIKIALEREELLFKLTEEELEQLYNV